MKPARAEIAWDACFLERHPSFAPLRWAQSWVDGFAPDWPAVADYASLAHPGGVPVTNVYGIPIKFHASTTHLPHVEYEHLIEQDSVVCTRERDWHDLLNALVWFSFPRAKAALHHAQWLELQHGEPTARSDAMRLFDENGVIVLCADTLLAELLKEMQWQELFWRQRERASSTLRFLPFGHGLCHKMLRPFIGITGKALILEVPEQTLQSCMVELLTTSDTLLASEALRTMSAPQSLYPLPILGIPGWWPQDAAFYQDSSYFRSSRRARDTHPHLTSA